MNKSELIEKLAAHVDCPKAQAGRFLDAFVEVVIEEVAKGEEVRLIGFGNFSVSERAARTGRNPQTGDTIKIAACKAPKFTPGAQFKAAVKG